MTTYFDTRPLLRSVSKALILVGIGHVCGEVIR